MGSLAQELHKLPRAGRGRFLRSRSFVVKVKAEDVQLDDGLLAISSLTRALGGQAQLVDVGSLLWILIRQIVPCDACLLYTSPSPRD